VGEQWSVRELRPTYRSSKRLQKQHSCLLRLGKNIVISRRHSCLLGPGRMLHIISISIPPHRVRRTDLDGIVAGQQRKHPNNGRDSRTLPVCYHAHGYARGIHAEVRSSALVSVRGWSFEWTRRAYDDIALRGRELELISKLRSPRRVGILLSVSLWLLG
jgi:hypothetical protein